MKNRILSIVSAALFVAHSSLFAQVFDPVKWDFASKKISSDEYEITFIANIEGNWHMYGLDLPEGGPIATSFNFDASDDYEPIGDIQAITKPEVKFDKSFEMELQLFSKKAEFTQRIKKLGGKPISVKGYIEFMSCDDERCLPPKEEEFVIIIDGDGTQVASTGHVSEKKGQEEGSLQIAPAVNPISIATIDGKKPEITVETQNTTSEITKTNSVDESKSSLLGIFLLAMLAGLAGLLTPCVYPMIPMTVSFFMQGSGNKGKSIFQGLFFGISIVLVYTLIGVLVALTGSNFTTTLNSHWIPNLIFFGLFLTFALSFFGLFEIVLPSGLANRFDSQADKGGLLGPFFMALTTVIVSFSCTGPIVGALLVKAAQGEILEPIIGMLGFAIVFALPFTLFAIFPNLLKGLPKSGGWLNAVKVVLGFIILAFGLKFISNIDQAYHLNILGRDIFLALWVVIFALLGFYLLGKLKFSHDSELKYVTVPRLMLAIATFAFAVYLIPGLFGAPLKAISSFLPPMEEQSGIMGFSSDKALDNGANAFAGNLCAPPKYADNFHLPHKLSGYFDYEQGVECAKKLNKPIFLDFKGHFCSNCKKMESTVWADSEVLKKLREEFVIIALYTDDKTKLPEEEWVTSPNDGKVKKTLGKVNEDFQVSKFGTNSIPLYAIVDHDGNLLTDEPFGYNPDKENFLNYLEEGANKF